MAENQQQRDPNLPVRRRRRKPKWQRMLYKYWPPIRFVLLIVIVILMNGALKDNLVFGQASMLIIGVCCAVIAYLNRFGQRPDSKLQKGIGIVLTVMAVIYIVMGADGLMQVL